MRVRAFLILSGLVLFCFPGPQSIPAREKMSAPDQDRPSLEILEFLGEWQTDDGRWIDPAELNQMTLPEQEPDHNDPSDS